MAGKMEKNGRFKEGHSGGPGRPPIPAFIRDAKKLTEAQFIAALEEVANLPVSEVETIAEDKSLPMRSSIMANWLVSARTDDHNRQTLLNRIFGKVPERVQVDLNAKLQKLSNDDLIAAGIAAVERVKAKANAVLPDQ